MFNNLEANQALSIYRLTNFLRDLRVIGKILLFTKQIRTDPRGPIRYSMNYQGYDPKKKTQAEFDALNEYFQLSLKLQGLLDQGPKFDE